MSAQHGSIRFDAILDEMLQPPVGPAGLTVLGGQERFSADVALGLLEAWGIPRPDMSWGMWEYLSSITPPGPVEAIPSNLTYLERARIFGEGGDLELRRDGEWLRWRFVGPGGRPPPPRIAEKAKDYWLVHSEPLLRRELTVLLWGERSADDSAWHEDRVGAAVLDYGVPPNWKRVALRLAEYSRAGTVAHVWWLGLERAEE